MGAQQFLRTPNKSGRSYRTADGEYSLPVEGHANNWRHSTVPIFGLVYDPDDGLIRWCDVTGHLRANPDQDAGMIRVNRDAILNEGSLRSEFTSAVAKYSDTLGAIVATLVGAGPRKPTQYLMPGLWDVVTRSISSSFAATSSICGRQRFVRQSIYSRMQVYILTSFGPGITGFPRLLQKS